MLFRSVRADTNPPGLISQLERPFFRTLRTGSRLATTTKSPAFAIGVHVLRKPPGGKSEPGILDGLGPGEPEPGGGSNRRRSRRRAHGRRRTSRPTWAPPGPRRISLRRQHGTEGAHGVRRALAEWVHRRRGPRPTWSPPGPGGFHCAGSMGPRGHTRRTTRACGMGPPKARTPPPPHMGRNSFRIRGGDALKRPRKSRRHRTTHRPNLGYTRPAGGVRRLVQYRM